MCNSIWFLFLSWIMRASNSGEIPRLEFQVRGESGGLKKVRQKFYAEVLNSIGLQTKKNGRSR